MSRAAIESLAENYSDGVVAPVFWAALFGLPGLLAYKVINTADSMIGHRTRAIVHFGWAAARLDDLLNLIPARLSGVLVCAASWILPGADPVGAWRAMRRDAKHHRSPNAGWPEAAFAGALGLAIAGPRVYHGELVEDHWMNEGGRPHAAAPDIRMALRLFVRACCAQAALLARLSGCSTSKVQDPACRDGAPGDRRARRAPGRPARRRHRHVIRSRRSALRKAWRKSSPAKMPCT